MKKSIADFLTIADSEENADNTNGSEFIKMIRNDMRLVMQRDLILKGIPILIKPRGFSYSQLIKLVDMIYRNGYNRYNY